MEGMHIAVLSYGNSSPILKTTKHNLNFVVLIIEDFIILGMAFHFILGGIQGIIPLLSNSS